jgi:hypothetical protein
MSAAGIAIAGLHIAALIPSVAVAGDELWFILTISSCRILEIP